MPQTPPLTATTKTFTQLNGNNSWINAGLASCLLFFPQSTFVVGRCGACLTQSSMAAGSLPAFCPLPGFIPCCLFGHLVPLQWIRATIGQKQSCHQTYGLPIMVDSRRSWGGGCPIRPDQLSAVPHSVLQSSRFPCRVILFAAFDFL